MIMVFIDQTDYSDTQGWKYPTGEQRYVLPLTALRYEAYNLIIFYFDTVGAARSCKKKKSLWEAEWVRVIFSEITVEQFHYNFFNSP